MSTLLKLIVFGSIAFFTYIIIYFRNKKNKKNSNDYIKSIEINGPDIDEVNSSVCYIVSSYPLPSNNTIKQLNSTIEQVGKFAIRYRKQIDRDRFFFVTESYDEELVPVFPGRLREGDVAEIYYMQRFIIRANSVTNNFEVYSDIHQTLKDKLIKNEFAIALFDYLSINPESETLAFS